MNTVPTAWPLCPRPKADESLPSWFERVGYEYAMSPALLLGAVEQATRGKDKFGQTPPAARLYDPSVADRLTALAKLSDTERTALWSSASEWELDDRAFCTYCPHCCIDDLANGRTPYGRRVWQQAWCTVCKVHGTALVIRNITHAPPHRSSWSHAVLKGNREFLAANRYRDLKVRSQPAVRANILGCLMEIEHTAAEATGGTAVITPTLGGSVPMYIFEDLGLTYIGLPIVNYDNRQHSSDENLRLGLFWRGMEIYASILADLKW